MEREAYERARNFDTETIRRQDEELEELRARIRTVESHNTELRQENETLERHVQRLERKVASVQYDLEVVKHECASKHPKTPKAPPDP